MAIGKAIASLATFGVATGLSLQSVGAQTVRPPATPPAAGTSNPVLTSGEQATATPARTTTNGISVTTTSLVAGTPASTPTPPVVGTPASTPTPLVVGTLASTPTPPVVGTLASTPTPLVVGTLASTPTPPVVGTPASTPTPPVVGTPASTPTLPAAGTPCTAPELQGTTTVSVACATYLRTLNPNADQKGAGGVTLEQLEKLATTIVDRIKGGLDFGSTGLPSSLKNLNPESIRGFIEEPGRGEQLGSSNSNGSSFDPGQLLGALGSLVGGGQNPLTSGLSGANPFRNAQNPFMIPQSAATFTANAGNAATGQVSQQALSNISENVQGSVANLGKAKTELDAFKNVAGKQAEALKSAQSALDGLPKNGASQQNELDALKAILETSLAHTKISQQGFTSTVGAINANGQAITQAVMAGNQVAMAQLEAMGAMSAAQNAQAANAANLMTAISSSTRSLTSGNRNMRLPLQTN